MASVIRLRIALTDAAVKGNGVRGIASFSGRAQSLTSGSVRTNSIITKGAAVGKRKY